MTEKEIKKMNKQKIKSYKKQLKSEIFDVDNELVFAETGEAQLDCKVGKLENIFSPYDIAKNRTINESFNDYLMQETEIIPLIHNLEIKLHVDAEIKPEQEEQLKRAIRRHFSFKITAINVKLKKNLIRAMLLYSGGLISLLLNGLTKGLSATLPISETLLIATWFFLWEGTNVAFLERRELKLKRFNMLRIYNAKVTIVKPEIN